MAGIQRRVVAETVGSALLSATVVGSGIMGERLASGNLAVALLVNSLATGATLVALILTLGPVSGAHLNPLVTLALASRRLIGWNVAAGYLVGQVVGAIAGVLSANAMFGEPVLMLSRHARSGGAQWLSEIIATFGLLLVVLIASRNRPDSVAYAVGGYIAAACWFTASTSFANPALTLARCLSDTFAGIRPADVPGFVIAQLAGAAGAVLVCGWLLADVPEEPLT